MYKRERERSIAYALDFLLYVRWQLLETGRKRRIDKYLRRNGVHQLVKPLLFFLKNDYDYNTYNRTVIQRFSSKFKFYPKADRVILLNGM